MDALNIPLIFLTALVSSLFGTLVGGSSLVTIPVLIFMGLPPHAAIGTDRLGVSGVGIAGLYSFHKKGLVNYKIAWVVGVPCLMGSFLGANLALQISPALMKTLIAVMTAALLVVVAVKPNIGVEGAAAPLTRRDYVKGFFFSLLVGTYGGFYGAGAATFLAYIMVLVFRQTFLEGAATLKIGAISLAATSGLTYAFHGAVHLPLAVAMFAGSCIGSYVGAHYSDRIGNAWIKRLFIGIVSIMVIKLILP